MALHFHRVRISLLYKNSCPDCLNQTQSLSTNVDYSTIVHSSITEPFSNKKTNSRIFAIERVCSDLYNWLFKLLLEGDTCAVSYYSIGGDYVC